MSNLYLFEIDQLLEQAGFNWIRYADDINIYVKSMEEGEKAYAYLQDILRSRLDLALNEQKSGVYDAYERWYLGYEFHKRGSHVLVNKHIFQPQGHYRDWHPCVVKKVNEEYHIVQNGILNKHDYALLFENDKERHHIPTEATEQLNLYNDVMITSSVIRTFSAEKVRLAIYDKYGNIIGYFTPESFTQDTKMMLSQSEEYNNDKKRLDIAKKIEIAAIHNIRANIRYYGKQKKELISVADELSQNIKSMNKATSVNELLLIGGRSRQIYLNL